MMMDHGELVARLTHLEKDVRDLEPLVERVTRVEGTVTHIDRQIGKIELEVVGLTNWLRERDEREERRRQEDAEERRAQREQDRSDQEALRRDQRKQRWTQTMVIVGATGVVVSLVIGILSIVIT